MKFQRGIRMPSLILALIAASCGILAYGQASQGRVQRDRMYDPKTETTVTGVIQEVKEVPGSGRGTGTHLIVKTGQTTIEVHLGPSSYLKKQKCELKKDAEVEILGSKVNLQGKDVLIARQIKKGGDTYTFRDAQGIPAWSGRNTR